MANMPNANKENVNYGEWIDVRDELKKLRKDLAKKEGRPIAESELLRYMTITAVNKRRVAHGQKPLDLDWRAAPKDRKAAA